MVTTRSPWSALLRGVGDSALFLAGVVQLLNEADSASLLVCALEHDDRAMAALLRECSPHVPFGTRHLLHFATAHGCLRAVHTLRKYSRPVLKSAREHYDINGELFWATGDKTDEKRTQLMLWTNCFHAYEFPEGVMYEAAKLGDLQVVQWLHTTTVYTSFVAVEHAARSGHLAVAQWLADRVCGAREDALDPVVEVTVPHNEALGIFACFTSNAAEHMRRRNDHFPRAFVHRSYFVFRGREAKTAVFMNSMGEKDLMASGTEQMDAFDMPTLTNPVVCAAETGNIELLEVLRQSRNQYNWSFSVKALVQTVANGHLNTTQWLIESDLVAESYTADELVSAAFKANYVHILMWLDTKFTLRPPSPDELHEAVQSGHLLVVIWLSDRFPDAFPIGSDCEDLLYPVTWTTDAKMAMWLHEHKGVRLQQRLLPQFSLMGDVALFEAFVVQLADQELLVRSRTFVFEAACRGGSVKMVQHLAETYGFWNASGMKTALNYRHFKLARWMLSTGYDISQIGWRFVLILIGANEWATLEQFFVRGKVDCNLNFDVGALDAHQSDKTSTFEEYPHFRLGSRTDNKVWMRRFIPLAQTYAPTILNRGWLFSWAARYNYTEILWHLVAMEYEEISSNANFERVLRYTRDGKLVELFLERRSELLSVRVVHWAAEYNLRELVMYVLIQAEQSGRKSLSHSIEIVITTASRYGHLGLLQWLINLIAGADAAEGLVTEPRKYDPWTSATCGQVHILQWLHDNRVLDESKLMRAMHACVARGQLTSLQWWWARYNTHHQYQFSVRDLRRAVGRKRVDIVEWILSKQPQLLFGNLDVKCQVDALLAKWPALRATRATVSY